MTKETLAILRKQYVAASAAAQRAAYAFLHDKGTEEELLSAYSKADALADAYREERRRETAKSG